MHNIVSRIKTPALYVLGFAFVLLLAFCLWGSPVKAADLNGSKASAGVDDSGPAILRSGCGFGVGFGYLDDLLNPNIGTNSKVAIGGSGEEITPSLGCHWVAGSLFLGAEASYGFIFGDLNSLTPGVGKGTTAGATGEAMGVVQLGLMLDPTFALYVHGDYGTTYLKNLTVSSVPEFGGGIGFMKRLPTAMPLVLDGRWSYEEIDVSKFSPGLPTSSTAHENKFGMQLIYQFYGK